MKIGDTVVFYNEYKDKLVGIIENIDSDIDSYEDVILEDNKPKYYSKKMKKYVPVKEKNLDSIFLTIKNSLDKFEFIMIDDVL